MEKKYLINREPAVLWHYFEDLSSIPRVSKNEAACAAYVVDVAKKHGLWYHEDHVHNVLVRVPASEGYEHLPSVLLEGHMDIVGEKTDDSDHDFSKDPLKLIVEGNILHADRTTLGADNGCACAIMLKVMTDKSLIHPPVECLFTVQEEIGCIGAKEFDVSLLQSRRAIGLDAGSEGVFRKGTTTKLEMTSCYNPNREPASGKIFRFYADGLKGGNQGEGIPLERICAIKQTARILHHLNAEMDVRLISIDKPGIQKSIPENCEAYVVLVSGEEAKMHSIAQEQAALIRQEYEESDPDFKLLIEPADDLLQASQKPDFLSQMMTKADSDKVINALYLMPYGAFNTSLSRLDECTCSVIAKWIHTDSSGIHIFTCISTERMDQGMALDEVLKTYMHTMGLTIEAYNVNRGWDEDKTSNIRDMMIQSYLELFHTMPKVNISHGGNDCVVLKHRIPELDVVTTAATYLEYHTPREHLYMDTFEKVSALVEHTLEILTR